MEPAAKAYLLRIIHTISLGLLWLVVNSTAGIMYGYAFPKEKIAAGNIIFYCWFAVSFICYLWFVIRLWSKPLDFEDKH
ncbi:MAG: hypothetical protein J0I09_09320 [Sphingobacteriia bacterium]|nr:hypothetical protein [Sphingobacteriia bacterium]